MKWDELTQAFDATHPSIHALSQHHQDIDSLIDAIPQGDWLLWMAHRLNIDNRILIRVKAECARTVLGHKKPSKPQHQYIVPIPRKLIQLGYDTGIKYGRGDIDYSKVEKVLMDIYKTLSVNDWNGGKVCDITGPMYLALNINCELLCEYISRFRWNYTIIPSGISESDTIYFQSQKETLTIIKKQLCPHIKKAIHQMMPRTN